MDIRPGDLLLVRGTNIEAQIIEDVTHSPYSHAAVIVKPNELIEAQGFRTTGYQGLDYYKGRSDIFTCDSLTDDQRQKIVQYVMSQVGKQYDYCLIAWELGHFILHIDCPFSEGDRHDCSTLGSDAYRNAGVDLNPGVLFPTPGDLALSGLLRKVGSF